MLSTWVWVIFPVVAGILLGLAIIWWVRRLYKRDLKRMEDRWTQEAEDREALVDTETPTIRESLDDIANTLQAVSDSLEAIASIYDKSEMKR